MDILYDYQEEAVYNIKNGSILVGGVGSGKSRTSLAYYFKENGGDFKNFKPLSKTAKKLYIITTARNRDTLEWDEELLPFRIPRKDVVIDSWNNIAKYRNVKGAFFIFDEQRVVSYGKWSQTFIRLAKYNNWILLSATPGDTWSDYIPVFIANGFYKNKTEFDREHCIFVRGLKFPKIERYINTRRLVRLRDSILIDMRFKRETVQEHIDIYYDYDVDRYKQAIKTRWNPYTNLPMSNSAELCQVLRRISSESEIKAYKLLELLDSIQRAIIFYNYNYERDLLLSLYYGDKDVAEWTGHAHQPIPDSDNWVYLVQYTAGNEGWNCIKTDTIIFFSLNYSYKVMHQAAGRIDRLNTQYKVLKYYHFKSHAPIDMAIQRALNRKQKFNENRYFDFKEVNYGALQNPKRMD